MIGNESSDKQKRLDVKIFNDITKLILKIIKEY